MSVTRLLIEWSDSRRDSAVVFDEPSRQVFERCDAQTFTTLRLENEFLHLVHANIPSGDEESVTLQSIRQGININ